MGAHGKDERPPAAQALSRRLGVPCLLTSKTADGLGDKRADKDALRATDSDTYKLFLVEERRRHFRLR